MGVLRRLSDRQEEFRAILIEIRSPDADPRFLEALRSAALFGEINEDLVVNLATVLLEMNMTEGKRPDPSYLIMAQEMIDHLDTLNLQIVPKHATPG